MTTQSGIHKALTGLLPLILLGCVLSCRDPFFPPSGTYRGVPLRTTPQGVITQLENAYENISYSLYVDLLPADGSFRFYVTPGFVPENPVSLAQEPRDTLLRFIGNYSYYYYWTQDIELKSQYALFQNASYIEFSEKPEVDYYPIISSHGDTTNYEVVMSGGELDLFFNDPDAYPNQAIEIDAQDFLLERDAKNLWVIVKWYDFGSQS